MDMEGSTAAAAAGLPAAADINGRRPSVGMRNPKKSNGDEVSWDAADSVVEGARNFHIEEQLTAEKYDRDSFVRTLTGRELTVGYLQKSGFTNPIHVGEKTELDMKMPNAKIFSVADVRNAVGSRRQIDVIDCRTQKNTTMTMKEWHKYFENSNGSSANPSNGDKKGRTEILNVISLEFSNTRLETQVMSPRIVRQIDWIDKVWPRHLKEMQIEATNSVDEMMYPKVQKYCLMSVEKCYTDFHIDFGGSSVWYHILQGKKIFFLIPPTDDNLKRYEQWVLSGKQADVFFGDTVEKCQRFEISAGATFFIPSGWIHAVYTSADSIVFGGNFLHSFAIEKQLQVAHIEDVTHVPSKFRFPFFTELLWHALDRYVHCLTGRTHLDLPEEEKRRIRLEKGENIDPNQEVFRFNNEENNTSKIVIPGDPVHVTQSELHGLKFMIMYLHFLPSSKKNVPMMLPDPIAIVRDIRDLVMAHKDDCPDQAITNKYILRWSENDDIRPKIRKYNALITAPKSKPSQNAGPGRPRGSSNDPALAAKRRMLMKAPSGNRRRRVRCKNCDACLGGDCRICVYCKDMAKYGGPGRLKQTCEKRRCLHPQLPICAFCSVCELDGWNNVPQAGRKEAERPEEPPNLFECTVCLDIVHPGCAEKTVGLGRVNPDLSNSWECANCLNSGYSNAPSRAAPVASKNKREDHHGDQQADQDAKRARMLQ